MTEWSDIVEIVVERFSLTRIREEVGQFNVSLTSK